jgi:ATP-dependent helicase/nuclease subunit A
VNELIDQAARARIRDDTASTLFVEAGAGSGKTSSLVHRVLTLVTVDRIPLSRIAAVTFTEKAGAELRDRLRTGLEEAGSRAEADGDHELVDVVAQALDDLDAAAIGTLHSFAQRALAMFPIQAGLPPLIDVLDEVGSSVAFDTRWVAIRRELLDDDGMAEELLRALGSGISLDNLRSLARAFGNDWDLIAERVLAHPREPFVRPKTDDLVRLSILLAERASECSDPDDKFLPRLAAVADWGQRLAAATTDGERFSALSDAEALKIGNGVTKKWQDLPGIKAEVEALKADALRRRDLISEATVRPLARWIAERVSASAAERRAEGRLEFHDLLVLARDLLRRDAGVREQLQSVFSRLLLDEFQDTDPIQIELAVRIAGGRDASADDWRDVVVPPGSLFVVGDPKQSIYRFRRASIETYLDAQTRLGEPVALTSNFRTVAPTLEWINDVFGRVIQESSNAQPAYRALDATRHTAGSGPAVVVLGATAHDDKPLASQLREREAHDAAATIALAIAEKWTVHEGDGWRPVDFDDIAVLVPARTSLPFLEKAFEEFGIPYRAEASSLVYQASDIRDLMMAARAIADASDRMSLVAALRSPLFGCGDDDLWTYRRDGGSLAVTAPIPDDLTSHPVGTALAYLRKLARDAEWLSPAGVLERLTVDRRVLEVAEHRPRTRDVWRQLRFVIDQARAWSDQQHGGLRDYLGWAARQADDSSRVAESVLPETDARVVRVMTVHAAKGLEFPMVVLSGMSSQPMTSRGVRLLWTADGYSVRLTRRMQTNDFAAAQPLDEQMDGLERRRLLYVAATRAEDHLVVSLHRREGSTVQTPAAILAAAGGADGALHLDPTADPLAGLVVPPIDPPLAHGPWLETVTHAQAAAREIAARSASGLEGTDPEVVLAPEAELVEAAGRQKGARGLDSPVWAKGRYGSAVGRAVHAVLQAVDLAEPAHVEELIAAQASAEGVGDLVEIVRGYVHSALGSSAVREASSLEHWKESFAGTTDSEGVLEGFIDLIYRRPDGSLVVVDYKTDAVPDAAIPSRVAYYAPQIRAYGQMVEAATGVQPDLRLVFLDASGDAARECEVTRI